MYKREEFIEQVLKFKSLFYCYFSLQYNEPRTEKIHKYFKTEVERTNKRFVQF